MTASRHGLSDGLIETALLRRAAGPPASDLLPVVLAGAVATPQRRGWRWPAVRRTRLAWLAVAAALTVALIVGLLAVGAGMERTPRPAVRPAPSLNGDLLVPSPRSAADGCLAPDAITVGSAMAKTYVTPPSIPSDVLDGSVYVTFMRVAPGIRRGDVWVVRSGQALRIAHIDDPGIRAVRMSDLSADGSAALLRIEAIPDPSESGECDALVVVSTDGTLARRLPALDPPMVYRNASFSPDGRFVAAGEGIYAAGDIYLYDLKGDARARRFPCSGPLPVIGARWAPERDLVLTVCGSTALVVDASSGDAVPVPIEHQWYQKIVDANWADGATIIVDTQSKAEDRQRRTLVLPAGPMPDRLVFSDPKRVTAIDPDGVRSPDGHALVSWIDDGTAHSDGYVIDLATRHRTRFATRIGELAGGVRWSGDSLTLAYGLPGGVIDGLGHVIVVDAASGAPTVYDLPSIVVDGIWRLP